MSPVTAALHALRKQHLDLMGWARKETGGAWSPTFCKAVQKFVAAVAQSGAELETTADRVAAQSMLDYWSAQIVARGPAGGESALELAPFERAGSLARAAAPPYPGLRALDLGDVERCFGRKRVTEDLLDKVMAQAGAIVVHGPPGAGKTSLVRAGLWPGLIGRRLDPADIVYVLIPPSAALADAALARARDLIDRPSKFLIVDGFENALIAGDADTFSRLKQKLVRPDEHLIVVVNDIFLRDAERALGLPADGSHRFRTPEPRFEELLEMLGEPARRGRAQFEEGALELLAREFLGEAIPLPLLQFTAERLWRALEGAIVTIEAVEKLRPFRRTLAQSARAGIDALANLLGEADARKFLLSFVEILPSGYRPKSAGLEHLQRNGTDVAGAIKLLTYAGVIRLTRASDAADDEQFDLTYAWLAQASERFASWIADERQVREREIQMLATARLWDSEGRKQGYLLEGAALEEARQYRNASPVIAAYVEASEKHAGGRLAERGGGLFALVVLLAIVGGLLLFRPAATSEDETQTSEIAFSERDNAVRELEAFESEVLRDRSNSSFDAEELLQIAPERVPVQGLPNAGCEGAIWLGSAQRLANIRNPPARAESLQAGQRITIARNLILRAALPPQDYSSPERRGVLPAGAEVEVRGRARPYPRPDGETQLWVEVAAPAPSCTTLFIQFFGDRARVRQVREALQSRGYTIPPIEAIASARGLNEIRYFHGEDVALAAEVAATIEPIVGASVRAARSHIEGPSRGTLEAWIDVSGQAAR